MKLNLVDSFWMQLTWFQKQPQAPTLIKTDNIIALDVITNIIKWKRTKVMDKLLDCITDIMNQKLQVYWAPGKENREYYYTKITRPATTNALEINYQPICSPF